MLLGLGGVVVAAPAVAEDEALRARVAAWIEDLRSDAFAVRREAREGLLRDGPRALDLLRPLADDPDAEVRVVVRRILREARGEDAPVVPGTTVDPWQVSLRVAGGSPRAHLTKLVSFLGGRVTLPEQGVGVAQLPDARLRGDGMTVLVDLLARAQLAMAGPFDNTGRLLLVGADPARPPPPADTVGPLEVAVTEVSTTRSLAAPGPLRYGLSLRLRWAPCIQVTQVLAPQLVRAVDKAGVAFTPHVRSRQPTSYGLGSTQTERTLPLTVVGGKGHGVTLEHLELRIPMRIRVGRQEVAFALTSDASSEGGVVAKRIAESPVPDVRVTRIQAQGTATRPQYVFDVEARLERADVAARSAFAVLTWSSGRIQRLHGVGQRRADDEGVLRTSARAYGTAEDLPKTLRFIWFEEERDYDAQVTLRAIPLRD